MMFRDVIDGWFKNDVPAHNDFIKELFWAGA
jgi:hypothetical protein